MSAIQKAILKACDIDPQGRDEDRQEFLRRCVRGINDLPDDAFNALSGDVETWFNAAGDVIDANKKAKNKAPLPDFPDAEDDEPAPRRRRAAAEGEDGPRSTKEVYEPKEGDQVILVTQKGREYKGKIIELTKKELVLAVGTEELEFSMETQVGTVEPDPAYDEKPSRRRAAAEEEEAAGPKEPAVGDTVELETKRGRKVTGEVVEIDDEVIVVAHDEDEKGEEFVRSRIESVKVTGGKKGGKKADPEPDEKPTRRGGKKDDDKDGEDKPKRTSNPKGVSVGQRIRELVGEDPDITEADIVKALKKEGIEFRDVTVSMNYGDCQKLVAELRKHKNLK